MIDASLRATSGESGTTCEPSRRRRDHGPASHGASSSASPPKRRKLDSERVTAMESSILGLDCHLSKRRLAALFQPRGPGRRAKRQLGAASVWSIPRWHNLERRATRLVATPISVMSQGTAVCRARTCVARSLDPRRSSARLDALLAKGGMVQQPEQRPNSRVQVEALLEALLAPVDRKRRQALLRHLGAQPCQYGHGDF
jgi:hypothetical protein